MRRIMVMVCMLSPWAWITANPDHSFDSQRLPRATPTPFRSSSHVPSVPRSTPKTYHTGQPTHWLPTIQTVPTATHSGFESNKYRTIRAPPARFNSTPASSMPSPRPFSFTAAVSLATSLTAQRQRPRSIQSFVTVPPELHTNLPAFTFTVRHPATRSTALPPPPPPPMNHTSSPAWASGQEYRLHLLRADIKRILQMQPQQNTTIDRLLETNFNLHTADPVYVFILPAESVSSGGAGHPAANRTLVLHRSNFESAAIYPSISAVQRRLMRTNITRLNRLIDNIDRLRPDLKQPGLRMAMRATATTPASDLDESESVVAQRIVAENVRTEPNFQRFMQLLNQAEGSHLQPVDNSLGVGQPAADGADADAWQPLFVGVPQIEYSLGYTTTTTERPMVAVAVVGSGQSVSWKDLGLDGWLGGIKEPGQSFQEFSQSHHSPESTSSRPQTAAWHQGSPLFKPHPTAAYHYFAYQTTHTRPGPTTSHFTYHPPTPPPSPTSSPPRAPKKLSYQQSAPPAATIPKFLAGIIPPELADLLLDTQSGGSSGEPHQPRLPRWPITSSRAQHTDDDVFIGRANNPFGHSTKWQMHGPDNGTELPPTPLPKGPRHLTESPDAATEPAEDVEADSGRSKRGALLLYSMIKCATGCDPLMYKGYGCYCGFLGSGRTLDGIDRCCQAHDLCYVRANCPMFLEYFVPYLWKCYRGRPLCAIDHGEWGGPGSCASRLCECDQRLSKCLRRFYCPRKRAVCTSSPWRLLQNVIML